MKACLLWLLAAAIVMPATAFGQIGPSEPLTTDAYRAVVTFFQYDKTVPLDVHVIEKSETK